MAVRSSRCSWAPVSVTSARSLSKGNAAYRSAKFLVMSSLYEGFGLVTAEALACGLPVIGFADCEGTNELVLDGRNGRLVDPGADRAEALSVAMRQLIDDDPQRAFIREALHSVGLPDGIYWHKAVFLPMAGFGNTTYWFGLSMNLKW